MAGEPIPDRIANAPELTLGLMLYMQAFFDLDSERQVGFSVGRIKWSAIRDYADAFEFDAIQTEDLFYFIKELDKVYLEWNKPAE